MDAQLENLLPEGGLWKGPEQTAWSCSWADEMYECVLSPPYNLIPRCEKLITGGVRATSESGQVQSTQRRQRKARGALVECGCASLSRMQLGYVVMKYMQVSRRRATTRTYGTAPSRLEGNNLMLSEWL